jgi:hypothetical protein
MTCLIFLSFAMARTEHRVRAGNTAPCSLVLGSYLGLESGYPDWDYSLFFSTHPNKYSDAPNQVTTAFHHIFSNQLIMNPVIRRYLICAIEGVI